MLSALLDLKFDRLIGRQLIGVAYAITLAVIVLTGLSGAIALIASRGVGIFAGLVLVPAVTLVQVLVARVLAEAVAVYFRAAEDLRAIRDTGAAQL